MNPRGVMHLTPPLTDDNALLVDEWTELLDREFTDDQLAAIVANADKAYRDGWGLRGQFQQRLNLDS